MDFPAPSARIRSPIEFAEIPDPGGNFEPMTNEELGNAFSFLLRIENDTSGTKRGLGYCWPTDQGATHFNDFLDFGIANPPPLTRLTARPHTPSCQ